MSGDNGFPPEIPADLYSPPDRIESDPPAEPDPPVSTRPAELPFDQLSWETFERLCLRVAAEGRDSRYAKLYGRRGQGQEGIDLYVRRSTGRYEVWQSKRYKEFTAKKIEQAVDTFCEGTWRKQSDTFVLCVAASLQDTKIQGEIERQARRLRKSNIEFQPLDAQGFSGRLRKHPEIIDDFFGRPWVAAFCGEDVARQLRERLPVEEAAELRKSLGALYRNYFEIWDSGANLPAGFRDESHRGLPLRERYIEPDLIESTRVINTQTGARPDGNDNTFRPKDSESDRRANAPPVPRTEIVEQRSPAFSWISRHERSILLGEAGSGKSTLLRVLALEILAEKPNNAIVQARWAGYLPIWLPFSFWTESIASAPESRQLKASLRRYLEELDAPERLWPLVERALRDRRLLLLVDGLDEWANEQAGRTALDLLRGFVDNNRVAAILTSRPLGYQRISGLDDRWRVTELAPLSRPQQQELTYRWFRHVGTTTAHPEGPHRDDRQHNRIAREQARGFIAELHQQMQLAILAGIPLLLWGLIALHLSQARLPRNRFAAYQKLTELLLHSHPAKRRAAALNRGGEPGLSPEAQDDALACLAFEALIHGEQAALEDDRAKTRLVDYMAEELGYSRQEGLRAGEAFLDIGSDATGLLIHRSSQHFGFMHRAFLEFLAAAYISRLNLDEQTKLIQWHGRDPRWRDAILATIFLTRRPTDTEALVQAIEEVREGPTSAFVRQRILTELACGPFQLPPRLAKRLAQDAFAEIETGTWMPQRRKLMALIVDGLESDRLRGTVQERIRHWFPDRYRYRSGIYEAMAHWPQSRETFECLWHGLHGTEGRNRRAAALALAEAYRGDTEVEERLKQLLCTPAEPELHAATLDALALGWPESEGLEQLVADARQSLDPSLRLVALRALVAARRQTDQDRDELLALALGGSGLPRERRDELADALVAGWPADAVIKDFCLDGLDAWTRRSREYHERVEHEVASRVLLCGYSSDPEMIERLAAVFEQKKYVSVALGHDAMQLLPQVYPNATPRLEAAIEAWIPTQQYNEHEVAYAVLAIRTDKARNQLLELVNDAEHLHHWSVYALVEGWGMDDPQVSETLLSLAHADDTSALSVAAHLPEIIGDPQRCRQRLLELARQSRNKLGFTQVTAGLRRLGISEADDEILETLLDQDFDAPRGWLTYNLETLMQFFPQDARVRVLARKELARDPEYSCIESVASWYGDDSQMRKEIAAALSPLPAPLRLDLVERLSKLVPEDEFAHSLLSEYERDYAAPVTTAAAIGYYGSVTHHGHHSEDQLDHLRQGLVTVGAARDCAPQAAFAGLLTLDRLDLFLDLKWSPNNEPVKVSFYEYLNDYTVLYRHVAVHWDRLKQKINGPEWDRLKGIGREGRPEFKLLAPHVQDGSPLEQSIVERIESEGVRKRSAAELSLYARRRPGTGLLKALCLHRLDASSSRMTLPGIHDAMTAMEIIGDQFGEDSDLRAELERRVLASKYDDQFALIALCAGWPGCDVIEEALRWYRENNQRLHYPTLFYLISDQYGVAEFCERMEGILGDMKGTVWEISSRCAAPIIRRLRNDEDARTGLLARLRETSTPNVKASVPGLLAAASGMDDELRGWAFNELKRQAQRDGVSEHGLSLSDGTIRPVAHVLMELLEEIRE
ncbi:NACHT domain-containing protein [Candidatus Thiosymbion oneisti]|uniref:NACHT domain-containing protein n=1 Tax=Candidatus Thiosymbion oneisti TaxID=589554 RepID=UPI000B7EC9D1|nr:NACHT domain-containing protein [Candidatus Thiosymbion oneisti]